ncbi:MAG: transcription antitermination protein NusB, partial [Bacteroidales bacterium]|nr:transcription antitermination protein NusB [Bacteroidales bacterium]
SRTVLRHSENRALIDRFTQNWEVERIAYIDMIIMEMAITELLEFPSIPIKVSLNEYIEIVKYYSTEQSSTFVNGVLDKIVVELRQQQLPQKQGRGLVGQDDSRLL